MIQDIKYINKWLQKTIAIQLILTKFEGRIKDSTKVKIIKIILKNER